MTLRGSDYKGRKEAKNPKFITPPLTPAKKRDKRDISMITGGYARKKRDKKRDKLDKCAV